MATNAGEDAMPNAAVDAISTAALNATVGMKAPTATTTDANTDQSATDTDEVEELKNPQACFMGLPAELRVRIYGFLFSGDWVKEEKADEVKEDTDRPTAATRDESSEDEAIHSETLGKGQSQDEVEEDLEDNKSKVSDNRDEDVAVPIHDCYCAWRMTDSTHVCSCFGPLHPAILRTNTAIYNEAMPIFYSSLEALGPLPHIHLDGPDSANVFDDLISSLPAAGLPYIKKIALVHDMMDLGARIEPDDEADLGDFAPMWGRIKDKMPHVSVVRINLRMNTAVYLREFAFHQFAGVAHLPNLRFVEIQLHDRGGPLSRLKQINYDGESMDEFKETFIGSIEREAKKLGKQVEVEATSGKSWPKPTKSRE
ncbi:hypothetical protein PRZ48_011613 [Zasmidium cellare]|uniref:Uncharacterized protein n=1 Tax=Zasmidium cellare TaxID=395010 RepID=A0ABR0E6U9_ZASCE|nr:hypothetical protein PRZ48_011613 [Zasmidium cellare]